jgi:hypothetical protein
MQIAKSQTTQSGKCTNIHVRSSFSSSPQVYSIGLSLDDVEKFHFARECLWPIIDSNFNLSKPVNYASLLALDRKVREFQYSDVSQLLAGPGVTYGLQMQTHASNYVKEHGGCLPSRCTLSNSRDHYVLVLLHLNRAFFSRAMAANPDSPHDTPYASSFLAIFRCSVTLLESVKTIYEKLPAEVIPFGLCWTDVLMSAVSSILNPKMSITPLGFPSFLLPSRDRNASTHSDILLSRWRWEPSAREVPEDPSPRLHSSILKLPFNWPKRDSYINLGQNPV